MSQTELRSWEILRTVRLVSSKLHLLPLPGSTSFHRRQDMRERERETLICVAAIVSSSFEAAASLTWLVSDTLFVAGPKAVLSWVPRVRFPEGMDDFADPAPYCSWR